MKRLSNHRCEWLKLEAARLLECTETVVFPLDGRRIITKLGASLEKYSELDEERHSASMRLSPDGYSMKHRGHWYVKYNDTIEESRIRMTLMHEAAHVWLDHADENETTEAEAKFFAKYIIAPPVIIYCLNLQDASQIMRCFGNSFEAASNSYNYYQKWLRYSGRDYTEQESRIMFQFKDFIEAKKPKEVI